MQLVLIISQCKNTYHMVKWMWNLIQNKINSSNYYRNGCTISELFLFSVCRDIFLIISKDVVGGFTRLIMLMKCKLWVLTRNDNHSNPKTRLYGQIGNDVLFIKRLQTVTTWTKRVLMMSCEKGKSYMYLYHHSRQRDRWRLYRYFRQQVVLDIIGRKSYCHAYKNEIRFSFDLKRIHIWGICSFPYECEAGRWVTYKYTELSFKLIINFWEMDVLPGLTKTVCILVTVTLTTAPNNVLIKYMC